MDESVSLRPLYGKLGGRTFVIIAFFSITGFILAWHNKLTDAFAALAASLSGFHVWRSRSEDEQNNNK